MASSKWDEHKGGTVRRDPDKPKDGGSFVRREGCGCGSGSIDSGCFQALQQSSGEGNGTPLQYSCLENPMDGGAWKAAVHAVAKSWT